VCERVSQLRGRADREAFKLKVAETYPGKKPGAIPNNAGQLYRFAHKIAKGDLVV
jgi:restriction system protein